MKYLVFSLLILIVRSTQTCSPCVCSYKITEKWDVNWKSANCQSTYDLTSIPLTLDQDIVTLSFQDQLLDSLQENSFIRFHKLEEIYLQNNLIRNLSVLTFKNQTFVKHINLASNRITILPTNLFFETSNIEELDLSMNNISILQSNLFSNLSYLQEIWLNNNLINLIEDNCFVEVPNLNKIHLENNNLKTLKLTMLNYQRSLYELRLHNNPWHCDENLCELMYYFTHKVQFIAYMPKCATPASSTQKYWTYLLQKITPLIIPTIRNFNYITQCKFYFASQVNWTRAQDKLLPINWSKIPTAMTLLQTNTNITILEKKLFSAFHDLIIINLSYNQIRTIVNNCFTNMSSLKQLMLNNNELMTLESYVFHDLNDLEEINLSNNYLYSIEEHWFSNKSGLKDVNINHNELTYLGATLFCNLFSLKKIDISYNEISHIDTNCFSFNSALESVDISNNKIIELPSKLFSKTTNLEILWLQNNKINFLQEYLFSFLSNLQEIYLYNNEIGLIKDKCFVKVPCLRLIHLGRNNLTNLQVRMIDNLNSLKRLYLHDNPWHCDEELCELMDTALSRTWLDINQVPKCATPHNTTQKLWTDLLPEFRPSIISKPTTIKTGDNFTVQCKYCFVSQIRVERVLINKQTLPFTFHEFENNIIKNDRKSLEYNVNVRSNWNREKSAYKCFVENCVLCKQDHVYVTVQEQILELRNLRSIMLTLFFMILLSLIKTGKYINRCIAQKKFLFPKENSTSKEVHVKYEVNNIMDENLLNIDYSVIKHPASENEELREGIFISIIQFLYTVMLCILFTVDIYCDTSLVIYFFLNSNKSYLYGKSLTKYYKGYHYGALTLFCLYGSSLLTVLYERRTRSKKSLKYYAVAIALFVLNGSGLLLFKDILKLRWKKIRLLRQNLKMEKTDSVFLNNKIKELATLKVIEAFTESFPILIVIIQSHIYLEYDLIEREIKYKAENLSGISPSKLIPMIKYVTSYIAFISTLLGYINAVTTNIQNLSICSRILKFFWLIFVIIARMNTTLIFMVHAEYEFIVWILLQYYFLGVFMYHNTIKTKLKNEVQDTMKTDFLTSSTFGIIFIFVPYLYTGSRPFYNTNVIVLAHMVHIFEILIFPCIYQLEISELYYHLFTTVFYMFGICFYYAFKTCVKSN